MALEVWVMRVSFVYNEGVVALGEEKQRVRVSVHTRTHITKSIRTRIKRSKAKRDIFRSEKLRMKELQKLEWRIKIHVPTRICRTEKCAAAKMRGCHTIK